MYIINNNTMYIRSNLLITVVKEESREKKFKGNLLNSILNESCIYYGSSLKGRLISSKNILGSRYKLPLIISEKNEWVFFPIKINDEEIWFNFNAILDYKKKDKKIEVYFKNYKREVFNISYAIFNNQMLKSNRLWMIYVSR